MRAGRRRRLRILIWIMVSGLAAGGAYGTLAGVVNPEGDPIEGGLIRDVEAVNLGNRLVGSDVPATLFGRPMAIMSVAFSFAASFAVLFMLQISSLVVGHTLAAILRGRYHRPRVEERFFLFVDVAGSTRDLEWRFIVSSDALELLAGTERYQLEDLGEQTVRGRAAAIHVFAVDGVKT
jgi:hypothetical protein